jgi:hypothetical protein
VFVVGLDTANAMPLSSVMANLLDGADQKPGVDVVERYQVLIGGSFEVDSAIESSGTEGVGTANAIGWRVPFTRWRIG